MSIEPPHLHYLEASGRLSRRLKEKEQETALKEGGVIDR